MYDGWHTSLVSSHMYLDSEIYFSANLLELFTSAVRSSSMYVLDIEEGKLEVIFELVLHLTARKKQIATRSCIYTIFFMYQSPIRIY